MVLVVARVQPILSVSRDAVGLEEGQAPDCSSITDARNNETLNILVKELETNLDLKFKMPDDQARQVRDIFLLVLFCFQVLLFIALKILLRTWKILIFEVLLDITSQAVLPKKGREQVLSHRAGERENLSLSIRCVV